MKGGKKRSGFNNRKDTQSARWDYYVPPELKAIIKQYNMNTVTLSLRMQRYPKFVYSKKKGIMEPSLSDNFPQEVSIPEQAFEFYKIYFNRYKTAFGIDLKMSTLETTTRIIVGMGNPSPFEVSIRLHHIYGVPIIPGTSVKGVTRSYFIEIFFESHKGKGIKSRAHVDKLLSSDKVQEYLLNDGVQIPGNQSITLAEAREIFGTTSRKGGIIFADAMPLPISEQRSMLTMDVITPHYSEYYSSASPNIKQPADIYDPTPIAFLTVKPHVSFYFPIVARTDCGLLEKAKLLVIAAMTNYGVGGKTSVNYGYFKKVNETQRKAS